MFMNSAIPFGSLPVGGSVGYDIKKKKYCYKNSNGENIEIETPQGTIYYDAAIDKHFIETDGKMIELEAPIKIGNALDQKSSYKNTTTENNKSISSFNQSLTSAIDMQYDKIRDVQTQINNIDSRVDYLIDKLDSNAEPALNDRVTYLETQVNRDNKYHQKKKIKRRIRISFGAN